MAEIYDMPVPSAQLSSYGKAIGNALRQRRGPLEFMGLEHSATTNRIGELVKRRAKNKLARASRVSNR
jgi:hypothetical protein